MANSTTEFPMKADPRFENFTNLFPYTSYTEHKLPWNVRFAYMPPSALPRQSSTEPDVSQVDINHIAQQHVATTRPILWDDGQKRRAMEELDRMIDLDRLSPSRSGEPLHLEFKTWLDKMKKAGIAVDTDRILRFVAFRKPCAQENPFASFLAPNRIATPERTDILGRSALFYAAANIYRSGGPRELQSENLNPETVGRLLALRDIIGATPLHAAVAAGAYGFAERCLELGANASTRTLARETALDILYSSKNSISLVPAGRRIRTPQQRRLEVRLALDLFLEGYEGYRVHFNSWPRREEHVISVNDLHREAIKYERGAAMPVEAKFPVKYPLEQRELCCFHLPCTNALVLYAIFRAIGIFSGRLAVPEFLLTTFNTPPTALGDSHLDYRLPVFDLQEMQPAGDAKPEISYIVFPCLTLTDWESFQFSRKEHRRLRNSRNWGFATSFIQTERSLDEAYFPSLDRKALRKRNNSQVVSREYKKSLNGKVDTETNPPCLVVRQLWVWWFENHIISAYCMPFTRYRRLHGHWDPIESYPRPDSSNLSAKAPLFTIGPLVYVMRMLSIIVDEFGEGQMDGKYPSPLDLFEIGVTRVLLEVQSFMKDKTQPRLTLEKEKAFIDDISDIRDELAMIRSFLEEQKVIIDALVDKYPDAEPAKDDHESFNSTLLKANLKRKIKAYLNRVSKINSDAERIEKMIQDQLNLKRTYATMDDARTGVLFSAAVIGFTIVTIIFTPLSFMTSLFALPIEDLTDNLHNKPSGSIGDRQVYERKYVGKWFAVAEIMSLTFTMLCILTPIMMLKKYKIDEFIDWLKPAWASKKKNISDDDDENDDDNDDDDQPGDHNVVNAQAQKTSAPIPSRYQRRFGILVAVAPVAAAPPPSFSKAASQDPASIQAPIRGGGLFRQPRHGKQTSTSRDVEKNG